MQRVLTEVAHDLWIDEDFREVIIEEPEVTGVEALTADSVTVRVMIKTLPLEQWAVARELRQRIKARFDHEGIEIPFAAAGGLAPRRGQGTAGQGRPAGGRGAPDRLLRRGRRRG